MVEHSLHDKNYFHGPEFYSASKQAVFSCRGRKYATWVASTIYLIIIFYWRQHEATIPFENAAREAITQSG